MRRSGRTTRILENAVRASADGDNVVVIVPYARMIPAMRCQTRSLLGTTGPLYGIRFMSIADMKDGKYKDLNRLRVFPDHTVYDYMDEPTVEMVKEFINLTNAQRSTQVGGTNDHP